MIELFIKPIISFIFGEPQKTESGSRSRSRSRTKSEKKIPKLFYEKFIITNFKGIKKVEISFVKDNLLLLLGLNESGKTTILKAIEAFDYFNDPTETFNPKYYTNLKKKSEVLSNTSAIITAVINLETKLEVKNLTQIGGENISASDKSELVRFIKIINEEKSIKISRVFPFKDGSPKPYYYQIEHKDKFTKIPLSRLLAVEIVQICPFILYFEDFKDRIPERIYIEEKSDSYDPIWYDIIDGLFYNTDENYNIESFKKFYSKANPRETDANIVIRKVNKTLKKVFTNPWRNLSGVKGIDSAELIYNHSKRYFQLNVFDVNSAIFTPEERSKGAIWYLSFLMKTEFRSKKMSKSSGMPIFLIDEPASNLHSTAQKDMIKDFIKLAKDTLIVYTTHSQYMISLERIKNTYIVQKSSTGLIKATKWSEFLQKNQKKTSYYQPIADLLQLIPNSIDIPWKKAIITEGPSDRKVLIIMDKLLGNRLSDYAIYPGTSANNAHELIALNIGWNASFKVFLDSDEAGMKAAEKYREAFNIDKEIYNLPRPNYKIEKCFSKIEKNKLYKLAFGEVKENEKISKKEFDTMFSFLIINDVSKTKIKNCLGEETMNLFEEILDDLSK